MNIRVVVPLKWNSQFREDLFTTLKQLGYKWSKGESLTTDKEKFHHMAYIAINCNEPFVTFSSKMNIVEKPVSECGLNYILVRPDIPKILSTINYIKQYLAESPREEDLHSFVQSHYELKDLFILS